MKMFTKTTFAIIALACFAQVISAQTVGQGSWMIGGQAGFSSQKIKDADNSLSRLYIQPNLGYFFADDLAVGLNINFTSTSFNGTSVSSTSVGPFLRYYVADPIFIQAGANLGLNDGAGTTIGAMVGYSLFLGDGAVAIEPALFFNVYNNDGEANDYTQFGLNVGIQAFAKHDH